MPRTTVDIEKPILKELKVLQKKEGKSLGRLVSELLSESISRRREGKRRPSSFEWNSRPMKPLIDISDKDVLYAVLDGDGEMPPRSGES